MKYFLGFLASIGLIILVFILVIRGLGGGDNGSENQTRLVDYANTNAVVSLTVDGEINANLDHRAFEITVGRSDVRMETYKGYEREVLESKNYQNTNEAYANFLRALELAGFTKGKVDVEGGQNDPRGVCATGQRYVLRITSGASDIQRYWATSCGGQGTFKGNLQQVRQLFINQVPDYSKLTNNLDL